MVVNGFKIVLIDVTFHLEHVQKVVFDVVVKNGKNENNRGPRLKGLKFITESIFTS